MRDRRRRLGEIALQPGDRGENLVLNEMKVPAPLREKEMALAILFVSCYVYSDSSDPAKLTLLYLNHRSYLNT